LAALDQSGAPGRFEPLDGYISNWPRSEPLNEYKPLGAAPDIDTDPVLNPPAVVVDPDVRPMLGEWPASVRPMRCGAPSRGRPAAGRVGPLSPRIFEDFVPSGFVELRPDSNRDIGAFVLGCITPVALGLAAEGKRGCTLPVRSTCVQKCSLFQIVDNERPVVALAATSACRLCEYLASLSKQIE